MAGTVAVIPRDGIKKAETTKAGNRKKEINRANDVQIFYSKDAEISYAGRNDDTIFAMAVS
jgi:hypothetical protein